MERQQIIDGTSDSSQVLKHTFGYQDTDNYLSVDGMSMTIDEELRSEAYRKSRVTLGWGMRF